MLRNLGRSTGINRRLALVLPKKRYEDRFHAALVAAVRPGDTVWDVGANVGLYTTLFSDLIGTTGHVVAFEPSPTNLRRLRVAIADRPNVTVEPVALGRSEGVASFRQGSDELGASSRIVEEYEQSGHPNLAAVQLVSGDHLILSGIRAVPNVIKIDTEGFEWDVLLGLSQVLQQPILRAVCVELHFALLKVRRLSEAPGEIEKLLYAAGFRVEWVDASHIVALRRF